VSTFQRRPSYSRGIVSLLIAGVVLTTAAPGWGGDPGRIALEYELKAVFISKLISFVEWPGEAFASSSAPLSIRVLGEDPFGEVLQQALGDSLISGRPVEVAQVDRLDELWDVHVLFVSNSEQERLCDVLQAIDGRPVLSISDFANFSERGGVLTLGMRQQRVRLSVNAAAYRRAGLTISAKLLQISSQVAEEPCP